MTDCSAAMEEAQRNLFSVTKPIVQGNTLVAPPDMDLNVFGMCEYVESFGCHSSSSLRIHLSQMSQVAGTDALTAVWVVTSSQHSAVSVRYPSVVVRFALAQLPGSQISNRDRAQSGSGASSAPKSKGGLPAYVIGIIVRA